MWHSPKGKRFTLKDYYNMYQYMYSMNILCCINKKFTTKSYSTSKTNFIIQSHALFLKRFARSQTKHLKRSYNKLMKGKTLRKHSLHEKTSASVLLKLFISGNEWWHTTDAPLAHEQNSIFKCKQHTCTLHDPWGPEKYDYTMM